MKLSKKNQARQRAIAKALASGKALGGLLAGIAATTLTGCDRHPFRTAGVPRDPSTVSPPANDIEEIFDNEAVHGEMPAVELPNEANEKPKAIPTAGKPLSPEKLETEQPNATNETEAVWFAGDIAIETVP